MPRQVLLRRAGVGTRNPQSRRTVAVRLDTTVRRVARAERRGLRQLRSSARGGRCGGATPEATQALPVASGGAGGGGAAPIAATSERKARADARPDVSGVMDEFRTSGPPDDPETLLPPPGDADEPPLMLLLAAAFVAGFAAMWVRDRRRMGPPRGGPHAPGQP